jgi:hypothetical protein
MPDPAERERLRRRWYELEGRIADLHDGKTVGGDPAETEAELFNEQDEIEYLLGLDEFGIGESA